MFQLLLQLALRIRLLSGVKDLVAILLLGLRLDGRWGWSRRFLFSFSFYFGGGEEEEEEEMFVFSHVSSGEEKRKMEKGRRRGKNEDICLKTCIIQHTDLTFTWYQYKQEQ